VTEIDDLKN